MVNSCTPRIGLFLNNNPAAKHKNIVKIHELIKHKIDNAAFKINNWGFRTTRFPHE